METDKCKIDTLKNSDYEKVRQLFMNLEQTILRFKAEQYIFYIEKKSN